MSLFECIQYNVEGDIDFFKELKNIATSAATSASAAAATEQKRCLITDEVLRPDAVTLNCGHSFNYIPLYKEVLFQKCSTLPKNISSKIMALYTKTANPNIGSSIHNFQNVQTVTYNSSINLETTKLHYDEVKCPYCRDITPRLLPYYPYPEVNQVKYVNSPSGMCLKGVACEYYKLFPVKGGGKINNKSPDKDKDKICESCPTYNEQYGLLCRTHLKKATASKTIAAVKPKKIKSENSIVSLIDPTTLPTEAIYPSDYIDNTKCGFLLVTGLRKGQPCGCSALKAIPPTTTTTTTTAPLCKRHNNK